MELMILIWLACAGICAAVASGKNLNVGLWLVLGLVFGVIAVLIVACVPANRA